MALLNKEMLPAVHSFQVILVNKKPLPADNLVKCREKHTLKNNIF